MADRLPAHCNYLALGAARLQEIKAITAKLDQCEHGSRVFQNLPRHMQRRAVSSNPRRLPRYLREKHMREGGGNVKPAHRPRRKYRRRPSNLLTEYTRRQRDNVWLETHLWHAKRFHMDREWGYALPHSPTFKGYRAALRAATKSCLMQDVSYLCCIELEGPTENLMFGLSRLLHPADLTTLTDTHTHTGHTWVSLMLYMPDRQPYGAVGEVDVMFHPSSIQTPNTHTHTQKNALTLSEDTQNTSTLSEDTQNTSTLSENTQNTSTLSENTSTLSEDTQNTLTHSENTQNTSTLSENTSTLSEDTQNTSTLAENTQDTLTHSENTQNTQNNTYTHTSTPSENTQNTSTLSEDTQNTHDTHKNTPTLSENTPTLSENTQDTQNTSTLWLWAHPSIHTQVVGILTEVYGLVRCEGVRGVEGSVGGVDECVEGMGGVEESVEYVEESVEGMGGVEGVEEGVECVEGMGGVEECVEGMGGVEECVEGVEESVEPTKHTPPKHNKRNDKNKRKKARETNNTRYKRRNDEEKHTSTNAWTNILGSGRGGGVPREKWVLPLVVRDPRVTLNPKKMPLTEEVVDRDESSNTQPSDWPTDSALYTSILRDQVTLCKESDAAVNRRRGRCLVPGSVLPETDNEERLPILLLARPPTTAATLGYGSGMDVIIPSGWGMNVWMSLLYCGGMAGGRHQAEHLHLEMNTPLTPHLLPDTDAGESHQGRLGTERRARYFGRPPNCRQNYIKLGVQFPFSQPWGELTRSWSTGARRRPDVYVLRDSRSLLRLAQVVSSGGGANDEVCSLTEPGCLVAVRVELCDKGSLEPCAMICLPTEQDLINRERETSDINSDDRRVDGMQEPSHLLGREMGGETGGERETLVIIPGDRRGVDGIQEPLHPDIKAQYRTQLKQEHAKIKGRMQHQRRKARQSVTRNSDIITRTTQQHTLLQLTTQQAVQKVNDDNKEIMEKYSSYNDKVEASWLLDTPDKPTPPRLLDPDQPTPSLRSACSREIGGYVTHGGFTHTLGRVTGVG
ncbi:hypothetical protein Pcinc_040257, partial [Petrolisthes cinctipes]